MTARRRSASLLVRGVSALLCSTALLASVSHADVTSSGLGTTVTPAGGVYDITGGTRPGSGTNLFHSFGNFSLNTPESANFLNDSGLATANILSRVTGGSPSNIFGTINSTAFPGANLFLINPAGIVFGPTAQLNVAGSFHATTADYVRLGADGVFYADPTQASVLTTSAPSAFGFLTANPAPIGVYTAGFDFSTFQAKTLRVPDGQTLSLVGGPMEIGAADGSAPGWLLAAGGRVNLVSAASTGEVALDATGGVNTSGLAQLGDMTIQSGSFIDSKNIGIRSGQLTINNATLLPGVFSLLGMTAPPNGGEVDIKATGDVTITGTGPDGLFGAPPGIFVFAGSDAAIVPGDPPDVRIESGGVVTVSGAAVVQSTRLGPGTAGNIDINADRLVVSDASIQLLNFYGGPGGQITVNANNVELTKENNPRFVGITSESQLHPGYLLMPGDPIAMSSAEGGSIEINATGPGGLVVQGGAQITTDSRSFERSGNIVISASDIFLSDGQGRIAAQGAFAGKAGDVTINATGQIVVQGGAQITASTTSTDDAGKVSVTAEKSISLTDGGAIFSATTNLTQQELDAFAQRFFGPGATFADLVAALGLPPGTDLFGVLAFLDFLGLASIDNFTAGNGGTVSVTTPSLTMNGGAAIETSTFTDGHAGEVFGEVGNLSMSGGATIGSRSGVVIDGTTFVGTGDAGSVNLNVNSATISGSGTSISTSTLGDGDGGTISLNAANQVLIENGGSVTADSFGAGLTGNINITSGDSITLDGGTISTRAVTSDGGDINLFAPNVVYLNNSQITTSVESGFGGGGNVFIDPQFVILNNSSIIANAFGGPGGNITIIADNFLSSALSVVEASSALSTPGVIQIVSPDNNVESSIQVLTAAFLDASSQLRGLCSARRTGAPSSFTVASRGGVPVEADGYLPSFATDAAAATAGADGPVRADAGSIGGAQLALVMPDSLNCAR